MHGSLFFFLPFFPVCLAASGNERTQVSVPISRSSHQPQKKFYSSLFLCFSFWPCLIWEGQKVGNWCYLNDLLRDELPFTKNLVPPSSSLEKKRKKKKGNFL